MSKNTKQQKIDLVQQQFAQLAAMDAELAPLKAQMDLLRQSIKAAVLDLGEAPEVEGGKIEIREGYDRTIWNTKMVEGFALAHPALYEAKTVTPVAKTVAISFK